MDIKNLSLAERVLISCNGLKHILHTLSILLIGAIAAFIFQLYVIGIGALLFVLVLNAIMLCAIANNVKLKKGSRFTLKSPYSECVTVIEKMVVLNK